VTDATLLIVGIAMFGALLFLAGSVARDDPRMRARWDANFEGEARELRRTDATGALRCRRCGASGNERAGACARCGAAL